MSFQIYKNKRIDAFLLKISLQLFLQMNLSNWTGPSRKQKNPNFQNKDLVVQ